MAKNKKLENAAVIKFLKSEGRITIKEGNGQIIEWVLDSNWANGKDRSDGIFLLFDLFQIRELAGSFSEVSLDLVEYASKPTVYHSPVASHLKTGPMVNGIVKFSLIRQPYWNKLLYGIGRPVIMQVSGNTNSHYETIEPFPLFSKDTKEMFLSSQGDIKILKA